MTGKTSSNNCAPPDRDSRPWIKRGSDWIFGYDFFISYCWGDGRIYAVSLREKLQAYGFKCFLDSSDYAKGDNWREQGSRALKRTSRLILVGTPQALESEPVENEVRIFSALGRRIYQIDIDGILTPKDRSKGIFVYLDPEGLRIQEERKATTIGPGVAVVDDIRSTFDLVRQDKRRIRWLIATLCLFAVVACTAIRMSYVADHQRKEAESARDQAEKIAAKSIIRTVGNTNQGALVSLDELEAIWELAEVPEESVQIRTMVLDRWVTDYIDNKFGVNSRISLRAPLALRAALGIASDIDGKVGKRQMHLARFLGEESATDHHSGITASRINDFIQRGSSEEVASMANFIVGEMRGTRNPKQLIFLGFTLGQIGGRLPEDVATEGGRLLLEAMGSNNNLLNLGKMSAALKTLGQQFSPIHRTEICFEFVKLINDTTDEKLIPIFGGLLQHFVGLIQPDSCEAMDAQIIRTLQCSNTRQAHELALAWANLYNIPKTSVEAAGKELIRLIEESASAAARNELGIALGKLSKQLPSDLTDQGINLLIAQMKNEHRPFQLREATMVLGKFEDRLSAFAADSIVELLVAEFGRLSGSSIKEEIAKALIEIPFAQISETKAFELCKFLIAESQPHNQDTTSQRYVHLALANAAKSLSKHDLNAIATDLTKETVSSSELDHLANLSSLLVHLGDKQPTNITIAVSSLLISRFSEAASRGFGDEFEIYLLQFISRLPKSDRRKHAELIFAQIDGSRSNLAHFRLFSILGSFGDSLPTTVAEKAASWAINQTRINYIPGRSGDLLNQLGDKLPEEIAVEAAYIFLSALEDSTDPHTRTECARDLVSLGNRLPEHIALRAARFIATAMENAFDSGQLYAYGSVLAGLSHRLPEAEKLSEYAMATILLGKLEITPEFIDINRKNHVLYFSNYCSERTPQQLTEILKWPFCLSDAEKIVLTELGHKLSIQSGDPVDFEGKLHNFINQAKSFGITNIEGAARRPSIAGVIVEIDALLTHSEGSPLLPRQ